MDEPCEQFGIIAENGKEIARCVFYSEPHRRIFLVAPALFRVCEAMLKADYEKKSLFDELENSMRASPDANTAARIAEDLASHTDPTLAVLEQMLAICMKIRGEIN